MAGIADHQQRWSVHERVPPGGPIIPKTASCGYRASGQVAYGQEQTVASMRRTPTPVPASHAPTFSTAS
jgi:hypothetical protein